MSPTIGDYCFSQVLGSLLYPNAPSSTVTGGLTNVTGVCANPNLHRLITLRCDPNLLSEIGDALQRGIDLSHLMPLEYLSNARQTNGELEYPLSIETQSFPLYFLAYTSPINGIFRGLTALQLETLPGRRWMLSPSLSKGTPDFSMFDASGTAKAHVEIKRHDKLAAIYFADLASRIDGATIEYQASTASYVFRHMPASIPLSRQGALQKICQQIIFEITSSTADLVVLTNWDLWIVARLTGSELSFSRLVPRQFAAGNGAFPQEVVKTPLGLLLGVTCLVEAESEDGVPLQQSTDGEIAEAGVSMVRQQEEQAALLRLQYGTVTRSQDAQAQGTRIREVDLKGTLLLNLKAGALIDPPLTVTTPFVAHTFEIGGRIALGSLELDIQGHRGRGRIWSAYEASVRVGSLSSQLQGAPLTFPTTPPQRVIVKISNPDIPLAEMAMALQTEFEAYRAMQAKNVFVAPAIYGVFESAVQGRRVFCMVMEDGGQPVQLPLTADIQDQVRQAYAELHAAVITHGDPTPRHWLTSKNGFRMIDFDRASRELAWPLSNCPFPVFSRSEMIDVEGILSGVDLDGI